MFDQPEKQSILIVDDAIENIKILVELLRYDYSVKVATSGEKALKIAFSNNPPDLIILDVVMPNLDGYEVCKKLKASPITHNIPIIFITVKDSEEDEIEGFELGAADYITKPIRPVVVKARVKTHAKLKKYTDLLLNISYCDGLTGIPNRRRFDEYLKMELTVALREKVPLSLIMLDIDHFKLFNDNYGHQLGDSCLIKVAQELNSTIKRKNNLFARYGGEEFACILPNTKLQNAIEIAERFRMKVIELKIPHVHSLISDQITISLGVASIVPDHHSTVEALITGADNALYKAKKSGRNIVCF
ncbi:diguanylate cyclase domain-containing protein [Clostridium thailandense]|uniref:diguanylate cyclase domain-containing protein n=1 Tax=Clostridium thailandense TaxID=2794346 RepID=UPI00398A4A16